MIENYALEYSEIWNSCSNDLPVFPSCYSMPEKLKREIILDQFLKSIKSFRKERMRKREVTELEERLFFENTRRFLKDGFDFTESQLGLMFSDEMLELTRVFVRKAHDFDTEMNFSDIFQALRNAWIMHGLQLIMGIPLEVTLSVFAYSMLYPYTDNLIDDPTISAFDKLIFSDRFRRRLSGEKLQPSGKTEPPVFRLVEMIEKQYSRKDNPEVYESLLGIHDAQTRSLKLFKIENELPDDEILKICLMKGGASVLADGYLIAGKLSAEQRNFLFGYGAYLQLLDDIQDLEEDSNAGLKTVFAKEANFRIMDEKLNKTYWFGEYVMKTLDNFNGIHIDLFKSLMGKSMDLFILEAVAQNPEAFSDGYVTDFERFSPFQFSFIRKRKEQFVPYNGFLLTAFEEIAFAESLVSAG